MTVTKRFLMYMYEIGKQVDRSPLGFFITDGLRDRVKNAFSRFITTHTVTAGDISARFYVDTNEELIHVKNNPADEQETLDHFVSNLQPSDVVYDIGANIGVYSCLAGCKDESIRVFAFEPLPANATRILDNAKLNDIEVTVIEVALSDEEGSGTMYLGSESQLGAGMGSLDGDGGQTVDVDIRRGDSLIETQSLPSPDVVKIDVEGKELEVLRGLEGIPEAESPRRVYVEVHDDELIDEIRNMLSERKFDIKHINLDKRTHLLATKPES